MSSGPESFRHITPVQIRFNDIDILGHVNNAIHQHYFDVARLEYFKKVLDSDIDWKEFSFVLASIHIDFMSPVKLNDHVSVRSRIGQVGGKSVTMFQELFDPVTGEKKSCNKAVLVVYSASANTTAEIPERWKEKIIRFEEKITLKGVSNDLQYH